MDGEVQAQLGCASSGRIVGPAVGMYACTARCRQGDGRTETEYIDDHCDGRVNRDLVRVRVVMRLNVRRAVHQPRGRRPPFAPHRE